MSSRERSDHRLAKLIKKARRQMSNAMRAELEPIGVSLPVVQILNRLASGATLSQLELAQDLELEPAALSRLLTEMEAQGLVTRRRDPSDRRRVLMARTASATALLVRAQPRVMAGLAAMFSRITGVERAELGRLLEKLACCDEPPARRGVARPERSVALARRRAGSRPQRRNSARRSGTA